MLNLLLLLFVAIIPFPTAVISEYSQRPATILYDLTIALTGLLSGAIWWYAAHDDRLIDPHLDQRQRRFERFAPLIIPACFMVSIGLATIDGDLARYAWVLTAPAAWLIR